MEYILGVHDKTNRGLWALFGLRQETREYASAVIEGYSPLFYVDNDPSSSFRSVPDIIEAIRSEGAPLPEFGLDNETVVVQSVRAAITLLSEKNSQV